MDKLAIITGTSRGLGAAIAAEFLKCSISVIGVARNENQQLAQLAEKKGVYYHHVTCDLQDLTSIDEALSFIISEIKKQDKKEIYLINNAAVVQPIHHSSEINHVDLTTHIQVNQTAPMIFTNEMLRKMTMMGQTLISITITSGAAERPIYGWSAYGSTKAAMNMYTKVVALEQNKLKTNHKVIAFNPGVMDTKMQSNIRSSSKKQFYDVETFKQHKEKQRLRSPNEVANILIQIILGEREIENGKIYDVREFV